MFFSSLFYKFGKSEVERCTQICAGKLWRSQTWELRKPQTFYSEVLDVFLRQNSYPHRKVVQSLIPSALPGARSRGAASCGSVSVPISTAGLCSDSDPGDSRSRYYCFPPPEPQAGHGPCNRKNAFVVCRQIKKCTFFCFIFCSLRFFFSPKSLVTVFICNCWD